MPQVRLSKAEKHYVEEGIREDVRSDGRNRLEFRPFSLEIGVVPQASGSAHLRLGLTEVLVAVKCAITEPKEEQPDCGFMEVSVACSPSAAWDFEGGDRERMDLVLTQALARILVGPNTVDWRALSIIPGKQWVLYVDATVIESGGNLLSAISIAARAALQDTKIPQISVVESSSKSIAHQIEVADDVRKYTPLDARNVPLAITLLHVGSSYVVDPSLEEEMCLASRLLVAVNASGTVCSVQKSGRHGTHPADLLQMLAVARDIAAKLLRYVESAVQQNPAEADPATADSYGFAPL